jgi:hypothetical protein
LAFVLKNESSFFPIFKNKIAIKTVPFASILLSFKIKPVRFAFLLPSLVEPNPFCFDIAKLKMFEDVSLIISTASCYPRILLWRRAAVRWRWDPGIGIFKVWSLIRNNLFGTFWGVL